MSDATSDWLCLPREVWDNITGRLNARERGRLALTSKKMEEICRVWQWENIRFHSRSQRALWEHLQWFIVKHTTDMETPSGRPLFTGYIKGATIDLSSHRPAAWERFKDIWISGGFRYVSIRPWEVFEPHPHLPRQILTAISLMPNLQYLSLILSGYETQLAQDQIDTFRQELRSLCQKKRSWPSVKDLCVITGDDDLFEELGKIAVDIVTDMVPNLEGLHIEDCTEGELFRAATAKHRGLKRLSVALHQSGLLDGFDPINAEAMRTINSSFPYLDTLVLHEHGFDAPEMVENEELALSELEEFIEALGEMQNLRRLSFQCRPGYWYAREKRLGLRTGWPRPTRVSEDIETHRHAWYIEMMESFEPISHLRTVAILTCDPDYYKGERDAGDQPFRISKKSAWGVPRGAWPLGIRD